VQGRATSTQIISDKIEKLNSSLVFFNAGWLDGLHYLTHGP
jgi:hypothetical protein